jgi:hypothetical protein
MGSLTRVGATAEFSGLLLKTLAEAGWRPSVQGRPEGGVLVKLSHPIYGQVEAEGDSTASLATELLRRATRATHAPARPAREGA